MLANLILDPKETAVPAEHRIIEPVIQKEFLVDGKILVFTLFSSWLSLINSCFFIKTWNGPMQDIFSVACIQSAPGEAPKPKLLGQAPMLDGPTAVSALEAAEKGFFSYLSCVP